MAAIHEFPGQLRKDKVWRGPGSGERFLMLTLSLHTPFSLQRKAWLSFLQHFVCFILRMT
jgi:hypothetical protein